MFVAPVVAGWVLCAGFPLPHLDLPATYPAWKAFMEELAARFSDVQFFGSHRVSDYAAWGRYREGRLLRAYAAAGDPLIEEGAKTPEEVELGFDFVSQENPDAEGPDEEDVLRLAGAWSVNPAALDEGGHAPGVGWVGRRVAR